MIEIYGSEGSAEYRVAIQIRDAILGLWPEVESSPRGQDDIRISASAKISGYQVQDIDVVVCGVLGKKRFFKPRRVLRDKNGSRLKSDLVAVENFVAAVEVKEQGGHAIRVSEDQVAVKYTRFGKERWKNASDQNISQLHSLKNYFKDRGAEVFLRRCLVFPSINERIASTAVTGNFDGSEFLSALAVSAPVLTDRGRGVIRSGSEEILRQIIKAPIFQSIKPSGLDRHRMDLIAQRNELVDSVRASVGSRMTMLRGHGGSGKTVALLQSAWAAYKDEGRRSVLLTYNHALAADIRRLLSLLGVPAAIEKGGICVETVMSFMYRWFYELGFTEDADFTFENYRQVCGEAVSLLKEGALTPEDIESVFQRNPDRLDYDLVCVDEGQDWPPEEILLLKELYGLRNLVVCDGVDQLIRGERADWSRGVKREDIDVIPFKKSLRLKRNLSLLVEEFAKEGRVPWDLQPNVNVDGGRVVVLSRPYQEFESYHNKIVSELREKGNAEVDMLFCVPPEDVLEDRDGSRSSSIGEWLKGTGWSVWEGVDEQIRGDFPRSANSFRVVQYASCRGLEGWVVVLMNFDRFLQRKYEEKYQKGLTDSEAASFENIDDASQRYAYEAGLIALTRPIDTLIIHTSDLETGFGAVIGKLARSNQDTVELY